MTRADEAALKVALVSRDGVEGHDRLSAISTTLHAQGLAPWRCRYDEGREGAFEEELLTCDAALVWVNPVQDGRSRRGLDAILRRTSAAGVW